MNDLTATCIALSDEAATLEVGAALAPLLCAGMVVYLEGDLGAGKTTLVRGVLRALGYFGKVKSPTYTLLESYAISNLNFILYHFDFYRFTDPDEFLEAGLDEFFGATGCCLVEWPDKAGAHVPPADLRVQLDIEGEGRICHLRAGSPRGRACLERLSGAAARGGADS